MASMDAVRFHFGPRPASPFEGDEQLSNKTQAEDTSNRSTEAAIDDVSMRNSEDSDRVSDSGRSWNPNDDALLFKFDKSAPFMGMETQTTREPLTSGNNIQQGPQGYELRSDVSSDGAKDTPAAISPPLFFESVVSSGTTLIPASSFAQPDAATTKRMSSKLAPVHEMLLKLKKTTPQSLPDYDPRVKANGYMQVLKSRLLPIGKCIEFQVNEAVESARARLEVDLWSVIWPNCLIVKLFVSTILQSVYRKQVLASTYRANDPSRHSTYLPKRLIPSNTSGTA